MEISLLRSPGWHDFALLDSGDGRKLERYGRVRLIRPEPQAMWSPRHPELWEDVHASFQPVGEAGGWSRVVPRWQLSYGPVRVWAEPTPFRHVGLFPEHRLHWDWVSERIHEFNAVHETPLNMLNLFAYTGMFSLVAAAAGASVTHVDASKKVLAWGKENQQLSKLDDRPIRWLEDDVTKFVEREIRRGRRYDGIILDPPKYGRGPAGETWKIFESLPGLLESCAALLSERAQFMILTTYAVNMSALSLHHLVRDRLGARPGHYECGELVMQEEDGDREIPTSIFSRWSPVGS